VIAGLKRNKALEPDKFRKWANILEQLTRDELMVIGKAISIRRRMAIEMAAEGHAAKPEEFSNRLKSQRVASGYQSETVDPLCISLVRTGLLMAASGWGGVMVYMPTIWLDELGELADVDGIAASRTD